MGAPTTSRLAFAQAGGDNFGLILDNVQLTVQSSQSSAVATPEPTTLGLFTTGLIGLGLLRWRGGRRSPQKAYHKS